MQQNNKEFYFGIVEPNGTIRRICNIGEIKDVELSAEPAEPTVVGNIFDDLTLTFEFHDNFNTIGRIFCVLNNDRKFKGMPMHRKIALKKAHKIAKRMQQDKLMAVDLAKEP